MFQVKTVLLINFFYLLIFPPINVLCLFGNLVVIVFLFPVLELVRLLNFKLKIKNDKLLCI